MNPKVVYTTEQREEVLELYNLGVRYEEITEKTGVGRGTITNWAKKAGLPLRHPKKCKEYKVKKCSYCGEPLDGKFKFCPYCGKDVRSEEDILIEELSTLCGAISLLPEGERDTARNTINEVKAYIRSVKK